MPSASLTVSALVKCYVAEPGSVWTRSILDDENNVVYVASLSRVETISALTRRFRRDDRSSTELIMVSADVELNAAAAAEGFQVEDPSTH